MLTPSFSAAALASQEASTSAARVSRLRSSSAAVKLTGARTIILGGGVAANTGLREGAAQLAHKLHCKFRRPPMAYCTDNAAMIAGLGYQLFTDGQISDLDLAATPTVMM